MTPFTTSPTLTMKANASKASKAMMVVYILFLTRITIILHPPFLAAGAMHEAENNVRQPQQPQQRHEYYTPGNATWLGIDNSDGEKAIPTKATTPKASTTPITPNPTPQNYHDYFPIIYVIFGLGGTPHVRAIVGHDVADVAPNPWNGSNSNNRNNSKSNNSNSKSSSNSNSNSNSNKSKNEKRSLLLTREYNDYNDTEEGWFEDDECPSLMHPEITELERLHYLEVMEHHDQHINNMNHINHVNDPSNHKPNDTQSSQSSRTSQNFRTFHTFRTKYIGNPQNSNAFPYKFPVRICELIANNHTRHGRLYRTLLERGELRVTWREKSYEVPRVGGDPERFLLMGDTGLRIKPTNLGLGPLSSSHPTPPCDAPPVYGIPQCQLNFTQSDLQPPKVQPQTGSYQGLDEWHLKELADDAAEKNVDVIIHVGDYLYRQGPCPFHNMDEKSGETKDCSAINMPQHATKEEIAQMEKETTMNFIPGDFGDNWYGWWSDFFYPMLSLLAKAPLIAMRGNHEICSRGGYGYFLFLSPVGLDDGVEDYCLDNFGVYSVEFEREQFIVLDDSVIEPLNGGVDKYLPGSCPEKSSTKGELVIPQVENRHEDPTDEDIDHHLRIFTAHYQKMEALSQNYDTNFYLGHRPLYGLGCNNGTLVTSDWTLQQSLGPTTLDRISAIISGHMHWLQVFQFEHDKLPTQIVVGNGGTQLIKNEVDQGIFRNDPNVEIRVGKKEYNISGRVGKGLTMSKFGYGIMERKENGDYEVSFYRWKDGSDEGANVDRIDFSILIPKGHPTVNTVDSSELDGISQEAEVTNGFNNAFLIFIVASVSSCFLYVAKKNKLNYFEMIDTISGYNRNIDLELVRQDDEMPLFEMESYGSIERGGESHVH